MMSVRFNRIGVLKMIKIFSLFSLGPALRSFIFTDTFCLPFFFATSSRMPFASPILEFDPVDINHRGLSQTKWRATGVRIWIPEMICRMILQSVVKYAINAMSNLNIYTTIESKPKIVMVQVLYLAIGHANPMMNPKTVFHFPDSISIVHTVATV